MTALARADQAIPYLALCYQWCRDHAHTSHILQFISLNQLLEAILNMFWMLSGTDFEDRDLNPEQDVFIDALKSATAPSPAERRNMFLKTAGKVPQSHVAPPPSLVKRVSRFAVKDAKKAEPKKNEVLLKKGQKQPVLQRSKTRELQYILKKKKAVVVENWSEPTDHTPEKIMEWLVTISQAVSSTIFAFGAHFRCFRPAAWLSRAIYKLIKHGTNHNEKAIRFVNRSIKYSSKYRMYYECSYGYLILGWYLLQSKSGTIDSQSVSSYMSSATSALRNIPDEKYTSNQLQGLISDFNITITGDAFSVPANISRNSTRSTISYTKNFKE
eukprot:c18172_g1_i1.p1 GENE.c18172_g1_i1~~c18172_g1_i1.p1  ORF type:complete len:328 (+),score=123.98 c18172_g1_i1:64-1047(+)